MKLLHCADLHIDSPMRGLDAYPDAPVDLFRGATRAAVEKLVALAIEEGVAAVTIGGDVFDGRWPDVNTGLWWNVQLAKLVDAGIEVYIVHGNHDAESVITRSLSLPSGVHVFGSGRPETVQSSRHPLAVHGQSYRDRAVTDDLAVDYPEAVPGMVNVGLLHTSLTGRDGHDTYAPTSEAVLRSKHYDLWALGHVHKREHQVFDRTHVLFPGNTQSRHAGEPGAKGVSIIETDGSRVCDVRHVDVDVVRWVVLDVDIGGCERVDGVVDAVVEAIQAARIEAGRALAVRVELTGSGAVWSSLQERLFEVRGDIVSRVTRSDHTVWIEKVLDRTHPPLATGATSAAVAAVWQVIERAKSDDELVRKLGASLQALDTKIRHKRPELELPGSSSLTSVEAVRELLPRAAHLLVSMLEAR